MRQTLDLPLGEVRLALDSEAVGRISGYAAVFNEIVPGYRERVLSGAFAKSLAGHKAAGTRPVMLWSHRSEEIVGVWDEITEDARGLKVSGHLITATSRGAEALELLKAGAVSGLSIGFNTVTSDRDATGIRNLRELDLVEISIVAVPAMPSARISAVRSDRTRAAAAFIEAVHATTRSFSRSNP